MEKRQSIGRKITLVVLSAVLASVFSATGFFLWRQTDNALESRHQQLVGIANVFSAVISDPVRANDPTRVRIALRAIKEIGIPYAVVTRNNGTILATMGTAIILTRESSGEKNGKSVGGEAGKKSVFSLFNSTTMPITVPVIKGGAKVGRLL